MSPEHSQHPPAADATAPPELEAGQRLGGCRVESVLEHGGPGLVYKAVREDDPARHVALELIRGGPGREDFVARFESERQVLSRLAHPYIAHILDGGTTGDGRFYLVKELVQGEPIDHHCDAGRRTVRQRLELFRMVCEAVTHAHHNLVLHRDLEPSKILITASGIPKLLDFGIARLLDGDAARSRAPEVLRWTSPEQVLGEPITTGTDVYNLGLLLHVLLTGRLPCGLDHVPPSQIPRIVCEAEPQRPSDLVLDDGDVLNDDGHLVRLTPREVAEARGTEPRELHRTLAGDLDSILLKALAKKPRKRYGSVEELTIDLRRYREGRPVHARKRSFRYRAKKLIRRRLPVFVALLMALGVAVISTFLWQRAERARERAQTIATYLENLLWILDSDETDARFPRRGTNEQFPEALLGQAGSMISDLEEDPELVAMMAGSLGRIYRDFGRYEEALPLLESSYRTRREHLGEEHPLTALSRDYLASVLTETGELDQAERLLRATLELEGRGPALHPRRLTRRLGNLAILRFDQGGYDQAAALFREVLVREQAQGDGRSEDLVELLEALDGLWVEESPERWKIADAGSVLGAFLTARGRFEEAEDLLLRSLLVLEDLRGSDAPSTEAARRRLVELYTAWGRPAAAERFG